MAYVLRFCASVLANTLAYQREKVLKKQNEALLQVARNLFNKLSEWAGPAQFGEVCRTRFVLRQEDTFE